jgi:hypothetical protein
MRGQQDPVVLGRLGSRDQSRGRRKGRSLSFDYDVQGRVHQPGIIDWLIA